MKIPQMANNMGKPLEIYIHIPFCVKKCAYCDFLSVPADAAGQNEYLAALEEELRALPVGKERPVTSVFVGGGTPTVVDAGKLCRILDVLKKKFDCSPDTEITIEANPGTLSQEKLELYRSHGVNRLSLGLQSAEERLLKRLGRIHTYEEFLESFFLARNAGFSNINVDLMFALPGQSCSDWINTLEKVAALQPEHISAYSMIVEEGTPFYEMELDLPDEDAEYQMYEDTASVLAWHGYIQYEISNYARPGFSCRHNEGYWRRRDYLGIGLGAASLLDGVRFSNTGDMEEYLRGAGEPEHLRQDVRSLTQKDEMEEFMFLGLRMTEGVSEKCFQEQFQAPLCSVYGQVLDKYRKLGLLEYADGFWRFTRAGIHVSNRILADFLV